MQRIRYPFLLSYGWAEPYRATRISEMIRGKTGLTARDMQALQTDFANLRARSLLPGLLPLLKKADLSSTEQEAVSLLERWDYE